MKTISKMVFYLIFFLLYAEAAYAQDSSVGSAKHAIGFSGGGAVGSGITYRLYANRSYYQGSFFARANSQEDISDFVVGASYGHILSEISIVKALPPTALVFVSGVQALYSKETYIESIAIRNSETDKSFYAGAGIALEIGNIFSPGLLLTIGTTYVLGLEQSDGESEWNLGPQFTLGLLYNW